MGETHQIANFKVAVCIHEEIIGLQVAVHDVCAVDVLEPAEDLVCEVADVVVAESLRRPDDAVQIGIHQVCDDEDVLELPLPFWRLDDVLDADDVLVATEMAQQAQLPQQQLALLLILDRILDLLHCNLQASALVLCSDNHPVRALPELLDDLILPIQVREPPHRRAHYLESAALLNFTLRPASPSLCPPLFPLR